MPTRRVFQPTDISKTCAIFMDYLWTAFSYDNPDSEGYTRHADELDAYWNYPQPASSSLFPTMRRFLTSFIVTGKPAIEDELHDWFLLAANRTQWKVLILLGERPIFTHLVTC